MNANAAPQRHSALPGVSTVTEHEIAWEVAEYLNGQLTEEERTLVFMDLGSGEFVAAIRRLVHIALSNQHALPAITVERLHIWSGIYDRHHEYRPLLLRIKTTPPR